MARRRKVHKGNRDARIQHLRRDMPAIVNPPHKMTPDELRQAMNQRRQAGAKGKSARQSREQQRKQHDRKEDW